MAQEKEFVEAFIPELVAAKERLKQKKEEKKKPKPKAEKPVEKPKPELAKPAPKALPLVPPIYRRALPPLPLPPRPTWPLPPPRPAGRPPEEEAAAPPTALTPTPAPPEIRPVERPRPLIIKPELPSPPAGLNLGKLNPLIDDPSITQIQCDGANLPLKIVKERRAETINLILSEDEIKAVIRAFSEASGQAITEPIFVAKVANLTLSAQISAFAGSKFLIKRE